MALASAKTRGVDVQLLLDSLQRNHKDFPDAIFNVSCVPHFFDAAHRIAHNKVLVVDSALVIAGSFNYTLSAEYHNAENIVTLEDPAIAAQYLANWNYHRTHRGA
jgi:phosphatidylserine/phosphatidylglycerophosphate/cardiolipin synthase-like enzyme